MTLAERERGLRLLVEQYREEECRRRLAAARAEATAILRQIYAKERAYLHREVESERHRARARIAALRADRETRARQRAEQADADLLAVAWPQLEAALRARWQSAAGRRHWAERALELAQRLLPAADQDGDWVIRYAPEWVDSERAELKAVLELGLRHQPRFRADGSLAAGLIIASSGAILDVSLGGLLRDRPRLEARLLALLQSSRSAGAGSTSIPPGQESKR